MCAVRALQPIDGNAFDLKYGLRLCHQANLHRACVHIYRKMGLLDEAVDLALEISNVDLAKMCAGDSSDTDSRKRLWRRIARHVVTRAKEAPERKAYAVARAELRPSRRRDLTRARRGQRDCHLERVLGPEDRGRAPVFPRRGPHRRLQGASRV